MANNNHYMHILSLFFIIASLLNFSNCSNISIEYCHKAEREALLQFKLSQIENDSISTISSWTGGNCCTWIGIRCDNITGNVIELNLGGSLSQGIALNADICSTLLSLEHLTVLDLSWNNFTGSLIPKFFGSFKRLSYLDLSSTGLQGRVPDELGNLSYLQHLDLSTNNLYVASSGWLSRLFSLRWLSVDGVNFRNASCCWLQALNTLPSIQEIRMSECELNGMNSLPLLSHVNFTSLTVLDLSFNGINSSVPDWFFNITSLVNLDLSDNALHGYIPASLQQLTSLEILRLSNNPYVSGFMPHAMSKLCRLQRLVLFNTVTSVLDLEWLFNGCYSNSSLLYIDISNTQLSGNLPSSLGNLKNLTYIDISNNSMTGSLPTSIGNMSSLVEFHAPDNELNGTIPESIGQLHNLSYLDLAGNSLRGIVSEQHFINASNLSNMYLSGNSLIFKVSDTWIPSFQLEFLYLEFCLVGPRFPTWLQTQKILSNLYLANTGIRDSIPIWFQNISLSLQKLDLSNNEICGEVRQFFSSNLQLLDLSNNSLSGFVSPDIDIKMPSLRYLSLSMNNLGGTIPLSLCEMKYLQLVRLSSNNLSGEPLGCWKNLSNLYLLDFSSNNLHGGITTSYCTLLYLESLNLSYNNLSGTIPNCLRNCTQLTTLELSYNNFTGDLSSFTGLQQLRILSLRSNSFTGRIPKLSHLKYLQVLDFSSNDLSGSIPTSLSKLTAMMIAHNTSEYIDHYGFYHEFMWVFNKGREFEYKMQSVGLLTIIDLSNNGLSGHIPEELGELHGLQTLNLSQNHLTGPIPQSINGLHQLQILDLSRNNLSSEIPQSLTTLNFLDHLNLSYNNLSGRIPTGYQLQTFTDSSVYENNPYLCGTPLENSCENTTIGSTEDQNGFSDSTDYTIWFFMSIAPGFVVGFLIFFSTLLSQQQCRLVYFQTIDKVYDMIHQWLLKYLKQFNKRRRE